MKIAMVTSWATRCGIFTYARDLATALAQENVETYIVRLPRFGVKTPEIVVDVAERIPYDKVDLVHVQHEYGLYQGLEAPFFTAVRMHGKPIVTTMHSVGNFDADAFISSVSNKVIVHNKYCANRFQFPNTLIPHGTTPAQTVERSAAKRSMNINADIPIVGYLGYISNYKGLETLIAAMVKVPKAGLLICGGWHVDVQNDYITKLKEWSKKLLGSRVMWAGFIPDESLATAYGAMDVLVYPSRFATESGALLHGIAYGKAVIASNVEPFREKEEEGALVTFKHTDDLAEKIQFLLDEPSAREKLEERARQYAEKTSWAAVAKQHVALFRELLPKADEPCNAGDEMQK